MANYSSSSAALNEVVTGIKKALKKTKHDQKLYDLLGLNQSKLEFNENGIVSYINDVHSELASAIKFSKLYISSQKKNYLEEAVISAENFESKIDQYNSIMPIMAEYLSANLDKVFYAFGISPNFIYRMIGRRVLSNIKEKIDITPLKQWKEHALLCKKPDNKFKTYTLALENFESERYSIYMSRVQDTLKAVKQMMN